MKKLTLAILMLLGSFSMASAELGINLGVSGKVGIFHGTGVETDTTDTAQKYTENAVGAAKYQSIFVEKTLGSRITVGYNYTPGTVLSSNTASNLNTHNEGTTDASQFNDTNTVQVDLEKMSQIYVALNITENLYIKAGTGQIDVITNEVMATDAVYGNFTVDHSVIGIGTGSTFGGSYFYRVEANYMDFDNITATSGEHQIELKDLQGAEAKFMIGKTF
ncbi:hypothetical protein N9K29_05090 [Candidatus Pelagibacter sp.]|nr:hypothetical protein [Candidatus Pelagibacter sp.]